jgi:WD40 repeat protein
MSDDTAPPDDTLQSETGESTSPGRRLPQPGEQAELPQRETDGDSSGADESEPDELHAEIDGEHSANPGLDTKPARHELPRDFPERIGDYRIHTQIARGGSSVVFRATQESLNRDVAIKVLRAGDEPKKTLARYERELQALTRLNHPGITSVFDAGIVEVGLATLPYIVMDLIEGVPLDRYVRENNLDVSARLRLFVATCDAVAAAHRQGIIHRDLKPSNILVTPAGRPHICDFGIARIYPADSATLPPLTSSHEIVGTIQYMSPEHVRRTDDPVDTRSDVYSLGLILFEMLTNQRAYDTTGLTAVQAIVAICEGTPPSVRQLNPSVPLDVATITAKAIEKAPDQRYSTVDAFAADVRSFLNHEPISARRVGLFGTVWRWGRRRPATAAAVFVAVFALMAGAAVSSYYAWQAELHARESDQHLVQLTLQSGKLEEQTRAATEAAGRARRTAFNATLGRIHRFTVSDPDLANELLDDPEVCPEELRGFAWRFLKNQNHGLVRVLDGHPKGTNSLYFNANGSRLLSSGHDARLRFWDTATGELLASLPCLSAGQPLAFSPAGDQAASSGPEGSIVIFPVKRGDPQPHLIPATGAAVRVCFIADSPHVAIATMSGAIEIWNQHTRKSIATLNANGETILHLDANDAGQLTAINSSGGVFAWETGTWEPLLVSSISTFNGISQLTRQRNWVATGRNDGRIEIFHDSGDLLQSVKSTYGVRALTSDIRGDSLFVAVQHRVEVFDRHTGEQTGMFRHSENEVTTIAAGGTPNAQLLAIAASNGPISLYDASPTASRTADLEVHKNLRLADVAYSPDGRLIAALEAAGIVRLLDARTLEEAAVFEPAIACADLEWFPDSSGFLLATRIEGNTAKSDKPRPGVAVVRIRERTANEATDSSEVACLEMSVESWWPPARMISRVALSPDGRFAAAAGRIDEVAILNASSGEVIGSFIRPKDAPRAVQFSPDSRYLAVGYTAGTLALLDAPSGTEVATANVSRGAIQSCVFSNDGRTLYTNGGSYGEVHCWTVPELQLQATWRGSREVSRSMSLSPDGRTLAVASRDHMVTLLDAETGDVQLELKAHDAAVTSLSFSSDGSSLVSASATQLRTWDAPAR